MDVSLQMEFGNEKSNNLVLRVHVNVFRHGRYMASQFLVPLTHNIVGKVVHGQCKMCHGQKYEIIHVDISDE